MTVQDTPADAAKNAEIELVPNDGASLSERGNAAKSNGKAQAIERLIEFYGDNPNASLSEAGAAIDRSKSTVQGYLSELQTAGRVYVNGHVEIVG